MPDRQSGVESIRERLLEARRQRLCGSPLAPNVNQRLANDIRSSDCPDMSDANQARWGRSRHEGFTVGQYLQAPPLIFTADHHPVWIMDLFRGRSAFLICGGPSFATIDQSQLSSPGILTMAVNNAVKSFRPNLWISVDSPDHFMRSIWLDPTIMKFAPICHAHKRIFNSDTWTYANGVVSDCPNVFYFKRNEHFQAEQFMAEDSFNWGNHKKYGGGRSIMLAAIRMLYTLGIRRVFLLGADFQMSAKSTYHFEQKRAKGSVKGNSSTYRKLNKWFAELRPIFESKGFDVFNCNPESELKVFDFVSFEDARKMVLAEWGNIDVSNERTAGLYDKSKPG